MKKVRERRGDSFVLVLVAGTVVPDWILHAAIIKDGTIKRKNRQDDDLEVSVRFVELPGDSEAIFVPRGGVMVRMPGRTQYSKAFGPLQVMEIRRSRVVEYNRELCPNCLQFTTEIVARYTPKSGKEKTMFHCTSCRHKWACMVRSQNAA